MYWGKMLFIFVSHSHLCLRLWLAPRQIWSPVQKLQLSLPRIELLGTGDTLYFWGKYVCIMYYIIVIDLSNILLHYYIHINDTCNFLGTAACLVLYLVLSSDSRMMKQSRRIRWADLRNDLFPCNSQFFHETYQYLDMYVEKGKY